jgi:hypothetical protein
MSAERPAQPARNQQTFSLRSLLIFVTVIGVVLGGVTCVYRSLRNMNVVARGSWPQELRELAKETQAAGDDLADAEVRYGGSIISYYWKMAATELRLEKHIEQFKLQQVQPDGVEEAALREWFPSAWRPPSKNLAVYAFPPGASYPPEGEYLFVLLHDQEQDMLYFYYHLDF